MRPVLAGFPTEARDLEGGELERGLSTRRWLLLEGISDVLFTFCSHELLPMGESVVMAWDAGAGRYWFFFSFSRIAPTSNLGTLFCPNLILAKYTGAEDGITWSVVLPLLRKQKN